MATHEGRTQGLGESYVLGCGSWELRIREASRRTLEGQEHGKGRALLTRDQPNKAWRWDWKHRVTPGFGQEASGPHTCLGRAGQYPRHPEAPVAKA